MFVEKPKDVFCVKNRVMLVHQFQATQLCVQCQYGFLLFRDEF